MLLKEERAQLPRNYTVFAVDVGEIARQILLTINYRCYRSATIDHFYAHNTRASRFNKREPSKEMLRTRAAKKQKVVATSRLYFAKFPCLILLKRIDHH